MSFIRRIDELDRNDIPIAGGKGANLGEMARAGLPVPPGFVLLTPAYRAFVSANGLQFEVERLSGETRIDDPTTFEAASAAIRELFHRAVMPSDIAASLRAAYDRMGGGWVAVRSSATAEDLPGASFAGQQETYLNITGAASMLQAVQRCWSSLWTARALAYRARQGIAPGDVALAVVVQRQVEAESAGILFTANPVTGRRDQMVIDGSWGLGAAVVGGQVTPDQWVVDAVSGAMLSSRIARKPIMTARRDEETATVPVPAHLQDQAVLSPDQVSELVAIGRQVAMHFGVPQDIEWAWVGGRFYLVQSRPITSLFPLPMPAPPGPDLRAYVAFNVLQGFMEPLTPMGIATFRNMARGVAAIWGLTYRPGQDPPSLAAAAGRIYIDVTSALRHPLLRKLILFFPTVLDRPLAAALRALAERDERLAPLARAPHLRPRIGFVVRLLGRALLAVVAPSVARRRAWADGATAIRILEAEADRLTGVADRVRFVVDRPADVFPKYFPRVAPTLMVGMACRYQSEFRLLDWFGAAAGLHPVLRALPHNPTTEMDLELWRLSRRLKAEQAEPRADHPGVQAFLAQYGHRAIREIDVGMPRWSEDPNQILDVLRTYLTHGEDLDPEAHFRRGAEEAERAGAELVERTHREKGLLRARLLRFLLARARALMGMREYPKFFIVRILAIYRRVLAAAGADLVAAGQLDRADDIFFLTPADLTGRSDPVPAAAGATASATARDLRTLAAANRAEYTRELGRRAIPRVMTSEGETFYGAPVTEAGALVGTPASAGVYEGRVRVIRDPKGAQLEPGEILVAPGTDPAWTPLFLSAGALVMEIGGIMSHGSVVAREYGIPAVVGVAGAMQQLRTGQRVRVDGEAGVVTVLE